MASLDLSHLEWARRGQWPREIKIVAYVVACLLGIGVIYVVWLGSLLDSYNQSMTEETHVKAEFEKKYFQSINLEVYKKQLDEIKAHFGEVLKQLPTQNEMPGLLEDISKTGIASGLTFELFAPAKEIIHPFYVELPVNITVLGTYHQIAIFLSRVAKINRVVTIHDFTLTKLKLDTPAKPSGNEANITERLILTVTIKIYRYKPS